MVNIADAGPPGQSRARGSDDYYAVGNDLREGRYPGVTVATFNSHWEAVAEMLSRNGGRDEG